MDAITIQILRNKIASLVDEMHYHFYRSGYSTIIRESRDFSCVILDRDGRLIVAPPMFFHAPVYRHLVGRILALYGARRGRSASTRRRRVRLQPSLRGRPAARLRHGVRGAGLCRRNDRRLRGLDRPQGRCRRHRRGLDLGQCHRDVPRRPADPADPDRDAGPRAARYRAPHPRQQPPAGAGARRHAGADRRDPDGRRAGQGTVRAVRRRHAVRRLRRHPRRRRRRAARRDRRAARTARPRPKAFSTATASPSTSRSSSRSPSRSRTASRRSISPPAIRRRAARSICAPRWSRPACSIA